MTTKVVDPHYLQIALYSLKQKTSVLKHWITRKQCIRKMEGHHYFWPTSPWPDPKLSKKTKNLIHLSKSLKCSQRAVRQHWTMEEQTTSLVRSSPPTHCPCSWNQDGYRHHWKYQSFIFQVHTCAWILQQNFSTYS